VSTVRAQPRPRAPVAASAPAPARRPAQPRTVRLRRHYPGRHVGSISVASIVAWQVALGLVVAGYVYHRGFGPLLIAGVLVLLIVATFTVVTWNGRSLWRWRRVRAAYAKRNRKAQVAPPHDPALAPLREWLPSFELASVAGRRGGRSVGVAYDGTGYVILLGPDREDLIASADPVNVPLRALINLGEAEGVRLSAAQLVVRTLPAPAPTLGPYGAQLAASYAEISTGSTPSSMSWWVALRLEPSRDSTALTLDGTDHDAIRRALRSSVGYATKVLSSSGLPCRPLEETELREVLTLTLAVDPHYMPPSRRERRTRETWRTWMCDGTAHVSGWVRSWPRWGPAALTDVLAAMASIPVLSATASLSFSWSPENAVRCSSFVRVCAPDAKMARTAFRRLSQEASRSGVQLVRLDGEQLPGVLATIPLGGSAP